MVTSVVVDSNIYIGLLRRGVDPLQALSDWAGERDVAICGMIRLEVERGLKIDKIRRRLGAFFDVMINVPTSNKIWEEATQLAWKLDRTGITLPAQDILIATCARSIGAAVLTDDAHFNSIPDLQVVRPTLELDGW